MVCALSQLAEDRGKTFEKLVTEIVEQGIRADHERFMGKTSFWVSAALPQISRALGGSY